MKNFRVYTHNLVIEVRALTSKDALREALRNFQWENKPISCRYEVSEKIRGKQKGLDGSDVFKVCHWTVGLNHHVRVEERILN